MTLSRGRRACPPASDLDGADSSCAVPSLTSRSSTRLDDAVDDVRASRMSDERDDDDQQDRQDRVAEEREDVVPEARSGIGHRRQPSRRGQARACARTGSRYGGGSPEADRDAPRRPRGPAARARARARGVTRNAGPQTSTAATTWPRASWTGAATALRPGVVLAERRRVAAPADPRQLLEERLELGDRPVREPVEAAADEAQDLALGQRRQQHLAGRRRSGAAPSGRSSRPSATRFGPSAWATVRSCRRRARRGRSSRASPGRAGPARASRSSAGRASARRVSARRMTTRPSRYLPVSSSCSTSPRFSSVASSREAVDLCRPRRRASSVTPASPWLSPRASSRAAARSTDRTAFPSSVIGGFASLARRHPAAGLRHRPVRVRATPPCARASRAASSDSPKIVTTRSTMSPSAWASHMNHGSRLSGSGIAPRACIPIATASYSSWSVSAQSRYSVATCSREHDAEHRRVAGEVVRQALRLDDLATPAWIARAGGVDRRQGVGVAQDLERLDGGGRRDAVARVGAAVADLVGQDAHDLVAPAERRGRVAVAHRLGVRREVRA